MTEVSNRDTIHEIFRIKTNIVNFRKCMHPHKAVIRKLITTAPAFLPTESLSLYFQNLIDHTKEIWDSLGVYAETLGAVEDTHLSLLNFHTNDVVRILTVFAAIAVPMNLIAGLFGMNARATPILGSPYDFWIIIGVMVLSMSAIIGFFKWRKWI